MKHVVRQLFTTFSFLGAWVLLLFVLHLVGVPMPHTHTFATLRQVIQGEKPAAAQQNASSSPAGNLPDERQTSLPKQIDAAAGTETSQQDEARARNRQARSASQPLSRIPATC